MIQKARKSISILLSLLMLLSVFGGFSFAASAESANTDDFVITDGKLTAYNGDTTALTTLVIPDGVKEIGTGVFKNCANLESVDLNEVEVVGGSAFYNCPKLSLVKGEHVRIVKHLAFITMSANLRSITIRSAATRTDSYLAVGGVHNAATPGSYLYVVVRKGEQGTAFEYMTFNCTFIIEEGVDAYIRPEYEEEQTQQDGVFASARIYIKDIDDENKTVVVSSNASEIAGFEIGKTIIIDGEDYTIVAPKEERFAAYKDEVKAAVEDLAEEGDSEAAQQIIADAVVAIDALNYDETKTLDENKAAVDAAADIADALATQRAADAALAEAKETLTDAVDAAKAFYETIKDDEKYADIAAALDIVIQQGEAMLNSDDADEILAKAEQISAAAAAASEQKNAIDVQPDEPADNSSICPWCGKTEHEIWWVGFVHSVFSFVKDMLINVLPKLMK